METEELMPCPQFPAIVLYPETDSSSPQPSTLFT